MLDLVNQSTAGLVSRGTSREVACVCVCKQESLCYVGAGSAAKRPRSVNREVTAGLAPVGVASLGGGMSLLLIWSLHVCIAVYLTVTEVVPLRQDPWVRPVGVVREHAFDNFLHLA